MGKIEIGSEEVRERYHKILVDNGINKEIKEVLIVEPELKGEHMASACDYVTIQFQDGSKDLELFVKKFVNNPAFAESTKAMAIFPKEAEFFNSFLPDAKKFCVKKTGNDKLINFFPKSYYGSDTIIVLENLVQQGYFMLDKTEKQGFDQALMVVKHLAQLHSVSHAMIHEMGLENFQKKYPYSFKEAFMSPQLSEMMGPYIDNGLATAIKMIEANSLERGRKVVEWIGKQVGDTFSAMCNTVINDPDETLLVINHGDCWNNNMMFLKDANGTITENLLLDLQITRYVSPNVDLGYFFFTSVKPEVRRKEYKTLLKIYLDTLKETTSILGSTVDISFDDFLENYKKKCLNGVFVGLIFMSTIGAMKEIDLENCGTTQEEMGQHFTSVVEKWVADNPELAKASCDDMISVVEDYLEVTGEA